MGRCSRYWRELCGSNSIWKPVSFLRWSTLSTLPSTHQSTNKTWHSKTYLYHKSTKKTWPPKIDSIQNWKRFYYRRHLELRSLAESQKRYYGGGTMQGKLPDYLCEKLASYGFGFADVMLFSFRSTVMVFINMIGLLYCIKYLKVSRRLVAKALRSRKIHGRRVVACLASAGSLYRALIPRENRGTYLTLEDVALGRRGKGPPWQNEHLSSTTTS